MIAGIRHSVRARSAAPGRDLATGTMDRPMPVDAPSIQTRPSAKPPAATERSHTWTGTVRRALGNDLERLRRPRRLLAIGIIALTGGLILAFLIARGELAGSDARAYWAGVRIWLAGGDPFHPTGPFLPYVYAPWSLLLFVPWALLPWDIAWSFWRELNILLLLWSAAWAYRRHPLATALLLAGLSLPIAATLDTGNITLLLALAVWAAQFVGPRLGGALWAVAASLKWFPVLLIVFLPPRARLWGLAGLAVTTLFALATWPQTLVQIDIAINFPRPIRVDYLLLLWGAVPWLWRRPRPLLELDRHDVPRLLGDLRDRIGRGRHDWRRADEPRRSARRMVGQRLRTFFGVH